jgi:hypothetical protein
VGSGGIRRRKPAHHLPKVRDRDLPNEFDLTPPMMWPDKGSGFEASPFSPAGRAQRMWWMMQGARRGRTPRRRAMGWAAIAILGVPLAISLLVQLLHLLG